jgi:hypothetical protein
VRYVSATSIGLFEQTNAHYGEIQYELGGRTAVSRSTTAEAVLETIFGPAKGRRHGVLRHLAGAGRGVRVFQPPPKAGTVTRERLRPCQRPRARSARRTRGIREPRGVTFCS